MSLPPARQEQISITISANPDAETLDSWDKLVAETANSDVSQLSAWASVRRTAGFTPLYVFFHGGGQLVAGAQILRRRLPVLGFIGYLPYGPLIVPNVPREPVCHSLSDALRGMVGRSLRILFVQPPDGAQDISAELQRRGFRPSDAGVAPSASLRIDLGPDEVQLRAHLNKTLRGWTSRWAGRGVNVRIGDEKDIGLLARLLASSAGHQGFEPLSEEYLGILYRQLASKGHVKIFVGEISGAPVAARLYTACGGVLKLRLVGMDRSSAASRLSVPAAVEWEAIRWAKLNGFTWFDSGGISEESASLLLAGKAEGPSTLNGPDWFKASFGGTPYQYPVPVEMIRSPVVRTAYDFFRRSNTGRKALNQSQRLLRRGQASRGGSRATP